MDRIPPVIRCSFTARKWASMIRALMQMRLLERGADPNRAGVDGMTFAKMLTEHQTHFKQTKAPPEFAALWSWAEKHGIVQQAQ
jgi:hypothetical protein